MSKTIASLITLLVAQTIPVEQIELVLEAGAVLMIWYSRYQAGDISILGFRKKV